MWRGVGIANGGFFELDFDRNWMETSLVCWNVLRQGDLLSGNGGIDDLIEAFFTFFQF